jgi:hypothetical protein
MDNIQIRDIQVGTEVAWHKKTVVEPVITKDNCRIVYPMQKQPLALPSGHVTQFYSIVSMDDGKEIGSPVSGGYALITNEQIWEMVQTALGSVKHEIVSVGTIANRALCYVSVKLAGDVIQAGGRDTKSVLNVLWGHGGKMSVKARTGLTVVVCQNTFNIALKGSSDFDFNVKHCGDVLPKLEGMSKAIDAHYIAIADFQNACDKLKNFTCKPSEAREIFAGFIVRNAADLEEVSTRAINQVDELSRLFSHGVGNGGADFADVFNATTDYFTHQCSGGANIWKQVESSEFGMGNTRKSEMFQLLCGLPVQKLGSLADVMERGKKVLKLA